MAFLRREKLSAWNISDLDLGNGRQSAESTESISNNYVPRHCNGLSWFICRKCRAALSRSELHLRACHGKKHANKELSQDASSWADAPSHTPQTASSKQIAVYPSRCLANKCSMHGIMDSTKQPGHNPKHSQNLCSSAGKTKSILSCLGATNYRFWWSLWKPRIQPSSEKGCRNPHKLIAPQWGSAHHHHPAKHQSHSIAGVLDWDLLYFSSSSEEISRHTGIAAQVTKNKMGPLNHVATVWSGQQWWKPRIEFGKASVAVRLSFVFKWV